MSEDKKNLKEEDAKASEETKETPKAKKKKETNKSGLPDGAPMTGEPTLPK